MDELHPAEQVVLNRAVDAMTGVAQVLAAYGCPAAELPHLLRLPTPLELAIGQLQNAINDLAALIAAQHGQRWAALPTDRKRRYQAEAFDLVRTIGDLPAALLG